MTSLLLSVMLSANVMLNLFQHLLNRTPYHEILKPVRDDIVTPFRHTKRYRHAELVSASVKWMQHLPIRIPYHEILK
jgi:hypothetical protein